MSPPRNPTHPMGLEITPPPVMMEQPAVSRNFVTLLSTFLGIVVATTLIVGFVGKYFYVDRTEYTQQSLRIAEDRGNVQRIFERVENTMTEQKSTLNRQEKAFDRMAETVKSIELSLARGRK